MSLKLPMTQAFSDTYSGTPYIELSELATRLGVDLSDLTTDETISPEGQGHGRPGSLLRIMNRAPALVGLATGFATGFALHDNQAGPALLALPPAFDATSISSAPAYGLGNRILGYAAGVALSYAPQVVGAAYQFMGAFGSPGNM